MTVLPFRPVRPTERNIRRSKDDRFLTLPTTPNVPPSRAFWSPFDVIWGLFKRSCGVLVGEGVASFF